MLDSLLAPESGWYLINYPHWRLFSVDLAVPQWFEVGPGVNVFGGMYTLYAGMPWSLS